VQLTAARTVHDPRVVPGADRVEAEASALSSTASNLIFSLQRRQGFGVRPAAYSLTKSSTTSAWKRSARSQM